MPASAAEIGDTNRSGFGSKKALLRAAMDVAVVGDAEPVPFVERDEFHRLARGPLAERMEAGVTVVTAIHERSAGVWRAIMEAAVADPEIDNWRLDLDGRTLDLIWVLLGRRCTSSSPSTPG